MAHQVEDLICFHHPKQSSCDKKFVLGALGVAWISVELLRILHNNQSHWTYFVQVEKPYAQLANKHFHLAIGYQMGVQFTY